LLVCLIREIFTKVDTDAQLLIRELDLREIAKELGFRTFRRPDRAIGEPAVASGVCTAANVTAITVPA
jgi:hypothetical protein